MSVILRRESGELVLLTKGAESSILPKCPQDEVGCLILRVSILNFLRNYFSSTLNSRMSSKRLLEHIGKDAGFQSTLDY